MAKPPGPTGAPTTAKLRSVYRTLANLLRRYEKNHLAKDTPEARQKAEANGKWAAQIEGFLDAKFLGYDWDEETGFIANITYGLESDPNSERYGQVIILKVEKL